jgi:AcrR family transcriptional regulator
MAAMRKKKAVKTPKGDQTRQLILDTALEMFRERGYEQTTMRAIAQKAGVSLGNAYYYFRSKEYLIQAFYQVTHDHHVALALPALGQDDNLKTRLLTVVRLKIETLKPYHQFAGVLFKTAADPQSPLNPFADEANPVRVASIELFEKVVEGSKGAHPERSARRVAVPALGLPHGDHPFLDPRPIPEASPDVSTNRSDGRDGRQNDLARQ